MNSIGCIAFTKAGCELAAKLARELPALPAYAGAAISVSGPARFAEEAGVDAYGSLASWTAGRFAADDALVFVGAAGIAVRAIAPHVRDKFSDPAVVSVDEAGAFAVPLLSGHVGGANELARAIAAVTGGQAAVSTATDVNGAFAVDEWAARRGFAIVERALAKEISARLLEGGAVGFASDFALDWDPPRGVVPVAGAARFGSSVGAAHPGSREACGIPQADSGTVCGMSQAGAREARDLGFAVTLDEGACPFERTLHLVPRTVTVGVGCRKDTPPAVLERAVDGALADARVSARAVAVLASIDVKAAEPAIIQLAAERGWDLRFYSAAELAAVPGDFAASAFVERTVGVDNVCERAACADGGTLLLGKQAADGVTVALAAGRVMP